jgi:Fe-S cluster biogenesis protein NfuA
MTLRQSIERAIRAGVSGIGQIYDVTDHASGRNPYYS